MAETKRAVQLREENRLQRQADAKRVIGRKLDAIARKDRLIDAGVQAAEAHKQVEAETGVKLPGAKAYEKKARQREANATLISTRITATDYKRLDAMAKRCVKAGQVEPLRSELARLAIRFMLDDFDRNPRPWLNDLASL